MGRSPSTPADLLGRPFTVAEAAAYGVTPRMLAGRSWRRVVRGVYCHAETDVDDALRLAAVKLVLPHDAVATGLLAAWAFDLWRPAPGRLLPLTWAVPRTASRTTLAFDSCHRIVTWSDDLVEARGLLCTSPERTALHLARRAGLVEAVVVLDAFAGAGLVQLPEFFAYVDAHRRWPGVDVLRRRLQHACSHSRSPGETRLRLVAVLGGCPSRTSTCRCTAEMSCSPSPTCT